MGHSAWPRVIKMIDIIIILIFRDNISINFVVNDCVINHDGNRGPVAEDVEGGENFLDSAVQVPHLYLETWSAIRSYEMNEDNHFQPCQKKYNSYKQLHTSQQSWVIHPSFIIIIVKIHPILILDEIKWKHDGDNCGDGESQKFWTQGKNSSLHAADLYIIVEIRLWIWMLQAHAEGWNRWVLFKIIFRFVSSRRI